MLNREDYTKRIMASMFGTPAEEVTVLCDHDAELRRQLASALEAQQKAERETTRTFKVLRDHGFGLNSGDLEDTVRQAVQAAIMHSANTTEAIRQRNKARATIQRLEADKRGMREALENAPHEEDCAYIGSLLRFDKFNGRKLPTVPCNCWKSKFTKERTNG